MSPTRTVVTLSALMMSLLMSSASAELFVKDANSFQKAAPVISWLSQSGSGSASRLEGFAKEVPLLVALKQIVPKGWKARKKQGVDVNQVVSWQGGDSWLNVLDRMATAHHIKMEINWGSQEIVLLESTAPALVGSSGNALSILSEDSTPAQASNRLTTDDEPQPQHRGQTWTVIPGKTLRQNIELWAATAGWSVKWEAANYNMVAGGNFTGEFDAVNGPVAQLISKYDDAEYPLLATANTKNQVLHVVNRTFKPGAVLPTSSSALMQDATPAQQ